VKSKVRLPVVHDHGTNPPATKKGESMSDNHLPKIQKNIPQLHLKNAQKRRVGELYREVRAKRQKKCQSPPIIALDLVSGVIGLVASMLL